LIGIGYKQVIFKFQTDSFLIKEIVLYDYSDVKDVYSISNVKYNVKVDPKKFVF
jgi:outer membrane lipoprotein-sorting protein